MFENSLTSIPNLFSIRAGTYTGLVCAGLLAFTPARGGKIPEGVFSLGNSGNPVPPQVLASPNVTGCSIRYGWKDIEPSEGDFQWDWLDGEVAKVAAAGKQVLLRIITQSARPGWVSKAVQKHGGSFFTWDEGGEMLSIPVFWDPTYLEKKKNMIAALGAHFSENPAVTIVTASFANARSEDWNVPHSPELVEQWLSLGYTSDLMLDAGQQIIDATMEAFPHQYVALSIGTTGGDLDPSNDYVARTTVVWAWNTWGRLLTQVSSLSTFIPPPPGDKGSAWAVLWNMTPQAGAQMVFRCINDPDYRVNHGIPIDADLALSEATDLGITYKVKYIEIYQIDVINLPKVIKNVQASLLGL